MNGTAGPVVKIELIWDGKYDRDRQWSVRQRVALPSQTVEAVNESTRERLLSLLRDLSAAYGAKEWSNRRSVYFAVSVASCTNLISLAVSP